MKCRCVRAVEDREADPIETSETCRRANPQVSISGLMDGLNAVLRQSILGAPNAETVVRWLRLQERGKDRAEDHGRRTFRTGYLAHSL